KGNLSMPFLRYLRHYFKIRKIEPTLRKTQQLMLGGKNQEALILLGECANLQTEDYEDTKQLHTKLKQWFDSNNSQSAATYCMVIASALGAVRKQQQSLLTLETFFDIESADYDNSDSLNRKLGNRLDELPLELSSAIYWALMGNLSILGRESES